jgi:hypothetical protein
MPNALSPELVAQLFAQESDDPFLTLVTLSHDSFADDVRLVNNSVPIISRDKEFIPFPMRIRFPVDDGETAREFSIEFDNVSLDLIAGLRTVTDEIHVKIEMILASMPNVVQIEVDELKIATVGYNKSTVQAKIILDNFLNTEMTSERYSPSNFPGLY